MSVLRYYYSASIAAFLEDAQVLQTLTVNSTFDINQQQRDAWIEEIRVMKEALGEYRHGQIIFEYDIPRLGRRVDVIALISGIIFVLEFKVGEDRFLRQDRDQVWDYALDLKNFQEASHDRYIVPVLIATGTTGAPIDELHPCIYDDLVYEPICIGKGQITEVIRRATALHGDRTPASMLDPEDRGWVHARYAPTPTIIQAASYMYAHHTVENITKAEASGESLKVTTEYISEIIRETRERGGKSICFVTGVPGAGKTLVGLNVAIQQFQKTEAGENEMAVYLSGNGPLVDVLTEALARDKKKRKEEEDGKRYNITDARREVKSFIQIIHHYRNDYLSVLKTGPDGMVLEDGLLQIDDDKFRKLDGEKFEGVENVAIFDEAQRAWTREALANWLNRKKNIPNFPYSEPEFLIWSLNLRQDWATIICLIGGGQEINTGEAGIAEWIDAVNHRFPDWKIYISPNLTDKEYDGGHVAERLRESRHVEADERLHLAVDMRSFRAESLARVVQAMLDLNGALARSEYDRIRDRYPIVLTRDINKAKEWLKQKARGTERYGIICSSQAYRLRPLSIDVRVNPDHVHWFLDDENDIRSSVFLEDVCTEFQVQGLELDWTCLVWDGDFRYTPDGWIHKEFKSSKWCNMNDIKRKEYHLNAYRVLLTRARQGMIICVPEGNPEDETRRPEIYNSTYEYLKQIGFEEYE